MTREIIITCVSSKKYGMSYNVFNFYNCNIDLSYSNVCFSVEEFFKILEGLTHD